MREIKNLQNVRNQYPKSQFIENQFDDCIIGIINEENIVYSIGEIFKKIKQKWERYFRNEKESINEKDLNKLSRQSLSSLLQEVNSSFQNKHRRPILKIKNRK